MELLFAILVIIAIIWIVIMLSEKKMVREFIRWYEQNIAIYDIFYPVLAKAIEQKSNFFESSSIEFLENVEEEPIVVQVDRLMIMVWKKTKVASAVSQLEKMFNDLADYSEKNLDTIKDFEELKSMQDDIYKKLYHIRLLRLNLPKS